jgi:hypothetical protein
LTLKDLALTLFELLRMPVVTRIEKQIGLGILMSLDFGLADAKTAKSYPAMKLSLVDDGYYWFCYPFFEELAKQTGEMIDLYDGAWFSGVKLNDLQQTLAAIRSKGLSMPEEWQQFIGHTIGSALVPTAPTPVYADVHRERLLAFIDKLSEMVGEAQTANKWIACLGD